MGNKGKHFNNVKGKSESEIPHVHDVHLSKKYQMEPKKSHTIYYFEK